MAGMVARAQALDRITPMFCAFEDDTMTRRPQTQSGAGSMTRNQGRSPS